MLDFYFWSYEVTTVTEILVILLIILQSYYLANSSKFKYDTFEYFDKFVEFIVLIEFLFVLFLAALTRESVFVGVILTSKFNSYLIYYTAFTILMKVIQLSLTQQSEYIFDVVALFAFMPTIFTIKIFNQPIIIIVALFYFLTRDVIKIYNIYIYHKNNLSSLSIKDSLDSLNVALLYYSNDGFIMMSNEKMIELMKELFSKIFLNGNELLASLKNSEHQIKIDSANTYLTVNEKFYTWKVNQVEINKESVNQLFIFDVTSQLKKIQEIEIQNKILIEQNDRLRKTFKNLNKLTEQKELYKIGIRMHDLMGHRLSMLQMATNNKNVDYQLLSNVVNDTIKDLKEIKDIDPQSRLNELIISYSNFNVIIKVTGSLFDDRKISNEVVTIIKEAISNAIIHGKSNLVEIKLEENCEQYEIRIVNNGELNKRKIIFGNGLRDISKRVKALNGNLDISNDHEFQLKILIKKEEVD